MSPVRLRNGSDQLCPALAVRQQSSMSDPTDTGTASAASSSVPVTPSGSTTKSWSSTSTLASSDSMESLPLPSTSQSASFVSGATTLPPSSTSSSSPESASSMAPDDRLSGTALDSLANSLPKYLAIGGILLGIVIFLAVLSCVYRSYKRRKRLGGGLASAPPPPPLKASSRTATTRRKFTDKPSDVEQGWKEYRRMSEAAASETPSTTSSPRGAVAGRRPLRSMSKETLKSSRSGPRSSPVVKSAPRRGQTRLRECTRSESPDEERATQTRRGSSDSYQEDRKSSLDSVELCGTPLEESRTLIDGLPREQGQHPSIHGPGS